MEQKYRVMNRDLQKKRKEKIIKKYVKVSKTKEKWKSAIDNGTITWFIFSSVYAKTISRLL